MYACFISYCHGQYELTKTFIQQLKNALKSYLEPWLDEEVYIDEERLAPGFQYNEALGRAICESICMIVVYSPRYERHTYCRREFEAMKRVEERRRALLNLPETSGRGMIIPIVFRGQPDSLPGEIREHVRYCDFSKFTTATPDISKNSEYVAEIEKIATFIHEHYLSFKNARLDVCGECHSFKLPAAEEVPPWPQGERMRRVGFPGREEKI